MADKKKIQPPPGPNVKEETMAEELKNYIFNSRYDCINYNSRIIQLWPGEDDDCPESGVFCKQFSAAFDYADQICDAKGKNFPEELIGEYEECLKRVQALINGDDVWWETLRTEILPMYERLGSNPRATAAEKALHDEWQTERWRKIVLFYDPVPMGVKSIKRMRGKTTGKIYSKEVISDRIIPEGLVIDIDGVGLSTIKRQ